jgi:acyl dehydratase
MPPVDAVATGDRLAERQVLLDQAAILRYAGASGDFNPLHWDPDVAAEVSPTGTVIAHGMLSLGLVSALVTDWAGGADRVVSLRGDFKAPCPAGATVSVGGEVIEVDRHGGTATLAIWVRTDDGAKVVNARSSRAVVSLTQD